MTTNEEAIRVRDQLRAMASNGHVPEVDLPDYPLDVWPDDLASYFAAASRCVGAPVAMTAVPATAILAGLIGNSRPIIRKAGYPIPPAIWTFDLAEPGTGKSPMLGHARRLVTKLQRDAKELHEAMHAEYEAEIAERPRNCTEPMPAKPPPMQHYYTDNATIESIAPICEHSAGITMIRDELVGWLNDLNVYRSGKGSDRQAWLTFWSGQEGAKTDRKSAGVVMPADAVVCITGSIQPGRFIELATESAKDGLLARFLGSIHPDIVVRDNDFTLEEDDLERARAYVWPLRHTGYSPGVPFSRRAIRLYQEWDAENADLTQQATGPVRHLLSKLPLHLLKLTALLHCLHDPGGQEREVTQDRVSSGIMLLEYHRAHTMAAYRMINYDAPSRPVGMRASIKWAIERCGGTATLKEIRVKRGGHDIAEKLRAELDAMVLDGELRMEVVPTAGRPSTQYTIASL